MTGPEAKIENRCVELAKDKGWLTIKCDKVKRSWPDQEFIGPEDRHFFVEFKAPGEQPREQQADRIADLRSLGHTVYVCDSVEQFISLFAIECAF